MYILKKDDDGKGNRYLALYWKQEDEDRFLGYFDEKGGFTQHDNCDLVFDDKDCRYVVLMCDQIIAGKFDMYYFVAEDLPKDM